MRKETIDLRGRTVLVTGATGFIGANLALELLRSVEAITVIGLDNVNDYYDVAIKEYRLKSIDEAAARHDGSTWTFVRGNLADKALVF